MNETKDIKKEIMESIDILLKARILKTTQSYYGTIISVNDKKCVIKLNGSTYTVPFYGNAPQINKKYPIIVPQGNFSQSYVIG